MRRLWITPSLKPNTPLVLCVQLDEESADMNVAGYVIKLLETLKQVQHTFDVSLSCLNIGILKISTNTAGCFSSLFGCSMLLLLDFYSRYRLHHHLKVVKCVFYFCFQSRLIRSFNCAAPLLVAFELLLEGDRNLS